MTSAARELIAALQLAPLPEEGGFFRATWRGGGPGGAGPASAIYFLVTDADFSALHRLDRDEIWCHHAGDAAEHWQLDPRTGAATCLRLGPPAAPETLAQAVVPAGVWQGTRLCPGGSAGYALFTCIVVPAWEPGAFTLGGRAALAGIFPAAAEIIRALTR